MLRISRMVSNLATQIRTVLLTGLLVVAATNAAWASSISWEWSGRASGSVGGVAVPGLTPFTIDVTFDSSAPSVPNLCPPGAPSAYYLFFPANIRILGYEYSASAAIESNIAISNACDPDSGSVNFRVFFGGLITQLSPTGTLLPFGAAPLGNFFLGSPMASALGGIPTTLPTNPFPTFGFNVSCCLNFTSVQIATVPEPATWASFVIGLVGLASTRLVRTRLGSRNNR